MNTSYIASANRANGLANLAVNLTTPALNNFKDKLEVLWIDHDLKHGLTALKREIKCVFDCGPKFVRVVRAEYLVEDGIVQFDKCLSRSAHCFIDRTNGNVLKTASWKTPVKNNPRGNIFEADPLRGVTAYGTVYLR